MPPDADGPLVSMVVTRQSEPDWLAYQILENVSHREGVVGGVLFLGPPSSVELAGL